jgi:hypothetical protein
MAHGVGILLLAAIGGYWLLERAEQHKGGLRRTGRLLAAFIIAVSVVGSLCKIACAGYGGKGWCPTHSMGKGGSCPFSSGAPQEGK